MNTNYYDLFLKCKKPDSLIPDIPNLKLAKIISEKGQVYHAIDKLCSFKYNTDKDHPIYYDYNATLVLAIEYYEKFYDNTQRNSKNDNTFMRYVENTDTPQHKVPTTKKRCYYRKKVISIIKNALSNLNKNQSITDEDVITELFLMMPSSAFSQQQLSIWKEVYYFATKKIIHFVVVNIKNHNNTQEKDCRFIDFAKWFLSLSGFTSKDRYFVSLFNKHYISKQNKFSRKEVDTLLRYYSSSDCFVNNDFLNMGIPKQDFFSVINTIKEISKKIDS